MNSITDYNTMKDTSTIFFGTISGGITAELIGEDGALRKCPVDIFSEWASMRRESQGAATGLAVSALNHVAHRMDLLKASVVEDDKITTSTAIIDESVPKE